MKGCEGQISLFDLIEPPVQEELLPCDSCGYCVQGCCDYPATPDDHCVLGDKKISVFPGDWVEKNILGKELTFDEIVAGIGKRIIIDMSTVSHEWYKVVLVEKIVNTQEGRRLVYSDGKKDRGYINERHFDKSIRHSARAWEIRNTTG